MHKTTKKGLCLHDVVDVVLKEKECFTRPNGTFAKRGRRGQSRSSNFDHLHQDIHRQQHNNNFAVLIPDATCVPRSFPDIESALWPLHYD
jgi:hypothetical protein